MIGFRRRAREARPGVERVDRDLLEVTAPGGRTLRTGCDSYQGVLSVWLVPGSRFTDGTAIGTDEWAWIEREVAFFAEASGMSLSVNRS